MAAELHCQSQVRRKRRLYPRSALHYGCLRVTTLSAQLALCRFSLCNIHYTSYLGGASPKNFIDCFEQRCMGKKYLKDEFQSKYFTGVSVFTLATIIIVYKRCEVCCSLSSLLSVHAIRDIVHHDLQSTVNPPRISSI